MHNHSRFLFLLCVLIVCIICVIWNNKSLEVITFTIKSNALPQFFSGFRIAHTSVLHNTRIGSNNINLLTLLCETQPDIIAITGDLIDSKRTDISVGLQFAEEAR